MQKLAPKNIKNIYQAFLSAKTTISIEGCHLQKILKNSESYFNKHKHLHTNIFYKL